MNPPGFDIIRMFNIKLVRRNNWFETCFSNVLLSHIITNMHMILHWEENNEQSSDFTEGYWHCQQGTELYINAYLVFFVFVTSLGSSNGKYEKSVKKIPSESR